ncbi:MAG: MlaD family protein [Candidatus Cloacimonetes bacterium]|nr:MlaD family protein [Candidatus Cloacimonadota bacterium]
MSELYSDSSSTRWKVGLVTIFCLAILVLGYAWLREWLDHKEYTSFTVWFPNANGIEPGDDVAVNGVKVGRVEDMVVVVDGVNITLKAHLEYALLEGTVFMLKESNLMGDMIVEILPGDGPNELVFEPVPRGRLQTGLSGFIANVDSLVERIEGLLGRLGHKNGLLASLQNAADSTSALMGTLHSTVRENRPPLHEALSSLAAATRQASNMLREDGAVDSTLAAMPQLTGQALRTLDRLESAAAELEGLARDVRQGEGTAGQLVGDDKLYEQMLRVTTQLDSLLKDIKRDPKRYFEIKVF